MFADILTQLRNENKISQKELANILKISRSTISMYELGKREPDFETLETIADYFNVDIDYLYGKSKVKRKVNLDYLRSEHADAYNAGSILKEEGNYLNGEFFEIYRKLSDSQKKVLLSVAKEMAKDD